MAESFMDVLTSFQLELINFSAKTGQKCVFCQQNFFSVIPRGLGVLPPNSMYMYVQNSQFHVHLGQFHVQKPQLFCTQNAKHGTELFCLKGGFWAFLALILMSLKVRFKL